MALSKLSGDEQGVVFIQLCNVLEPGIAVAFGSANSELWALTQAQRQQLRADNEAAAALCLKMGMRSCKALREAKTVHVRFRLNHLYLCAADLATLGSLGSVLPVLEKLYLFESSAGPDGVQRLMAGLGRGALPALAIFDLEASRLGDAGASALAAALGRGALPQLKVLNLQRNFIGNAGLVALAPALRGESARRRGPHSPGAAAATGRCAADAGSKTGETQDDRPLPNAGHQRRLRRSLGTSTLCSGCDCQRRAPAAIAAVHKRP